MIAEKILVDERTQKITAVNLIESITSVTYPYFVQNPYVMVALHKDDGDPEDSEGLLLFLMDDEEIARTSFLIGFDGLPRSRSIIELNGFSIPKAGHLKVCVTLNGAQQGEWDILATQIAESTVRQSKVSLCPPKHHYFAAIKSGSSAVTLRDRATFFGFDSTTTGLTLARSSSGFR